MISYHSKNSVIPQTPRASEVAFSRSRIISKMDKFDMYIASTSRRITYATTNCHTRTKLGEATRQGYGRYTVNVQHMFEPIS